MPSHRSEIKATTGGEEGLNKMTTTPQAALLSEADLMDCVMEASQNRPFIGLRDVGNKPSEFSKRFASAILAKLQAPQEPAQAGELPPLPEPAHRGPTGTGAYFNSFTADQMHAYARAALAARKPAVPLTLQQATAICICLTSQRVSVSEVQRKLRIGWNEAKDLCKTLVDSGLLGDIEISNHINGIGLEVKP